MKNFKINEKVEFDKKMKIQKRKRLFKKIIAANIATFLVGTVTFYGIEKYLKETKIEDEITNEIPDDYVLKNFNIDNSDIKEKEETSKTMIPEMEVPEIEERPEIEKEPEVEVLPPIVEESFVEEEQVVEQPPEEETTDVEQPAEEETPEIEKEPAVEKPAIEKKQLALTFDDGPGPYTKDLLKALDSVNAKATFFVVGTNVQNRPEIIEQMQDNGHLIGNHTYDHINFNNSSIETIENSIERTNDLIEQAGGRPTTIVRPPYGALSESKLQNLDYSFILWSVDTRDWETREKEYVKKQILDGAKEGEIILLHDIHKTTVDAVVEVIDELANEYELVTVDELFDNNLQPYQKYYRMGR